MSGKVNGFRKVVKMRKNSQKAEENIVKNKAEQKRKRKRENALFLIKTEKNRTLLIKIQRFIRNESFV